MRHPHHGPADLTDFLLDRKIGDFSILDSNLLAEARKSTIFARAVRTPSSRFDSA